MMIDIRSCASHAVVQHLRSLRPKRRVGRTVGFPGVEAHCARLIVEARGRGVKVSNGDIISAADDYYRYRKQYSNAQCCETNFETSLGRDAARKARHLAAARASTSGRPEREVV